MTRFRSIRDWFRRHPLVLMLVVVVAIKLFFMFGVLRVFFFQPTLHDLTPEQKAETVGGHLVR